MINPVAVITGENIMKHLHLLFHLSLLHGFSVKTDRPIPKEKITECMALINEAEAKLPIAIGDVIIEDAFGSRIVATQNRF